MNRHAISLKVLGGVLISLLVLGSGATPRAETAALWQALATGGHLVLMRHALAPGTGDPAHFELDDCTTQRNLSGRGIEQARRIGDLFRANGISGGQVYTSQWCRCRDTAVELRLGDPQPLSPLNSFFGQYEKRDAQTRALAAWIRQQPLTQPTVLVTHQVNITALTGVYPSSGELVFAKRLEDGSLEIVGTIATDELATKPR